MRSRARRLPAGALIWEDEAAIGYDHDHGGCNEVDAGNRTSTRMIRYDVLAFSDGVHLSGDPWGYDLKADSGADAVNEIWRTIAETPQLCRCAGDWALDEEISFEVEGPSEVGAVHGSSDLRMVCVLPHLS